MCTVVLENLTGEFVQAYSRWHAYKFVEMQFPHVEIRVVRGRTREQIDSSGKESIEKTN